MNERYEYLPVPFEEEPQHPDLEAVGIPVDINDPRLVTEEIWDDPAADAFATFVTVRAKMDRYGQVPESISVLW
jgi:hypothetical protein